MAEEVPLKSLRDRPFELLAELERRGRAVSAQVSQEGTAGREWVGVALRMAGDLYLVAREETREVLGLPPSLTRVPGAKQWIKGLANVRGQLLPFVNVTPRQRIHATLAIAPNRSTTASHTAMPTATHCQPVHCHSAGRSRSSGASIAEISAPKKTRKRPTSAIVRNSDAERPLRQAQPAEASQARTSVT